MNELYILETENILPGDIILTSADELQSKAVRKLTSGEFSHALLYMGNGSYIHSDMDGVHSGNIQRLILSSKENALVLRLQERNEILAENLCTYARTQIGKQYSIPEAVKSKKLRHKDRKDESNRQFCSRLVAQAYDFAGLSIVPNVNYCYPKDIASSKFLKKVDGYIRVASKQEVKFAKSESPLKHQTEVTNKIFEKVREISKKDIQTFEQLIEFLLENTLHDNAISEIIKNSGYLELWEIDVKKNPWRYDAQIFMDLNIARERKIATASNELISAEAQLQQFQYMGHQYLLLWQRAQLRYFALEIALYKKLVDLTNHRIKVAKAVLINL